MVSHLELRDSKKAFVEEYYNMIQKNPEDVFKLYRDSSMISRTGPDGTMLSVSSKKEIYKLFSSLNYKAMKITTKTSDALISHDGGILMLVTGFVELDNLNRNFAQTLFLARERSGFFVASDIFRYVGDKSIETSASSVKFPTVDQLETGVLQAQNCNRTLECSVLEHARSLADDRRYHDDKIVVSQKICPPQGVTSQATTISQNEIKSVESATTNYNPKLSFASIARLPEANKVNTLISSDSSTEAATVKIEKKTVMLPTSAAKTLVTKTDNAPKTNIQRKVEPCSIFVRGLPLLTTVSQLEDTFKKFGPIKTNGVQVISKPGLCYGFVAFSYASSQRKAIKASPLVIDRRRVIVEVHPSPSPQVSGNNRGRSNNGGHGHDNYEARRSYAARGYLGNVGNDHDRGSPGRSVNDRGRNGGVGANVVLYCASK